MSVHVSPWARRAMHRLRRLRLQIAVAAASCCSPSSPSAAPRRLNPCPRSSSRHPRSSPRPRRRPPPRHRQQFFFFFFFFFKKKKFLIDPAATPPGGSLTVPTTAQAQASSPTCRAPSRWCRTPPTSQHAGRHHQGRARLRAGRVRPAEVGRGQPPVDPRLGPVAQLPPARHPALHGRHPDQHRRRLRRFPGDRSDRLPLRRGLQGRQRAALRRQLAGRRHQLRDADRPRRQPVRAPAPTSAASASTACRRARAAPTGPSISSSPAPGRSRTASATTAGASRRAPAPTSAISSRPTSRRASTSTPTTSCSAFRAA